MGERVRGSCRSAHAGRWRAPGQARPQAGGPILAQTRDQAAPGIASCGRSEGAAAVAWRAGRASRPTAHAWRPSRPRRSPPQACGIGRAASRGSLESPSPAATLLVGRGWQRCSFEGRARDRAFASWRLFLRSRGAQACRIGDFARPSKRERPLDFPPRSAYARRTRAFLPPGSRFFSAGIGHLLGLLQDLCLSALAGGRGIGVPPSCPSNQTAWRRPVTGSDFGLYSMRLLTPGFLTPWSPPPGFLGAQRLFRFRRSALAAPVFKKCHGGGRQGKVRRRTAVNRGVASWSD
jgi:hypothetical protein